jgi:hypothetical protein
MTITISPAFLLDVAQGKAADAEIWDGITEQQLADWEGEWMPELFKALQCLRRAGVDRQYWPQSRHWNWRNKAQFLQGSLSNPGFSVMCGGVTQGLMILESALHRCRIDEQAGKHIMYVEYLENAPWNRKELLFNPIRYRGVGSLLIRSAIELSIEEGFKGRIGLHSLPQSESWYAKTCGMTDLGVDKNKEGLRYFEMTAAQAEAFIRKGN